MTKTKKYPACEQCEKCKGAGMVRVSRSQRNRCTQCNGTGCVVTDKRGDDITFIHFCRKPAHQATPYSARSTPPKAAPRCNCDPTKVESRGLCPEHGFESPSWLTPERKATKAAAAKPLPDLLRDVLVLADVAIDAWGGDDEPLYSEPERLRLRAIVIAVRDRMSLAEQPVRFR